MKRLKNIMGLILLTVLCLNVSSVLEASELSEVIEKDIESRSKYTSTFDLYDAELNAVRNLKIIDVNDEINTQDGQSYVRVRFRDVNTADIILMNAYLNDSEEGWLVNEYEIHEIESSKQATQPAELENVTKEDVQGVINRYIEQKTKFSDTFDIYDEERQAFLKLKFVSMAEEMRNFGRLYIITVRFKDTSNQSDVDADFTIENKSGKLKVKKVKIKS